MNRRKFVKTIGLAAGAGLLGKSSIAKDISLNSQLKRPNILFIMTDQQSADVMSWKIGKKYISTPAMDEIASRGVVFARAYSANPLCVPCRTSIFTGLYPHQTKVETNLDINTPLAGKFKNMGAIFKETGYDTGYVGKWHMAFPVNDSAAHGFEFMRSTKNNGIDAEIPTGANEFLKIKRDKPFLLVTSFVNPHNICEWARGDALPDGEVGNPPSIDECPPKRENYLPMKDEPDIVSFMRKSYQNSKMFPVGNFDEKKWREYQWSYYRMIEKTDALIGRVINSLRQSGQYENTIIVFTSDHGDMQGAHGWNQKTVLYEESVRIPFIICEPGRQKTQFSSQLVNTGTDILPTLCDFAGIDIPANMPGASLKGITRSPEKIKRKYVVVENKMIQGVMVDGIKEEPSGRMVRSEKYKYCVYDRGKMRESLVDLETDPGEMINLVNNSEYRSVLEQHRLYLKKWCSKTNDNFCASSEL